MKHKTLAKFFMAVLLVLELPHPRGNVLYAVLVVLEAQNSRGFLHGCFVGVEISHSRQMFCGLFGSVGSTKLSQKNSYALAAKILKVVILVLQAQSCLFVFLEARFHGCFSSVRSTKLSRNFSMAIRQLFW